MLSYVIPDACIGLHNVPKTIKIKSEYPKFLSQQIRKYKTLDTSVIYNLMSPPSLYLYRMAIILYCKLCANVNHKMY